VVFGRWRVVSVTALSFVASKSGDGATLAEVQAMQPALVVEGEDALAAAAEAAGACTVPARPPHARPCCMLVLARRVGAEH
jgi:hypothetical protein